MLNEKNRFYELTINERLKTIQQSTGLSTEQIKALSGERGLSLEQANAMIENVVGTYSLPMGIAQNFIVNGREILIPMVVEEPSVVAGASFMAKLARSGGGFSAHADEPIMTGQMQILEIKDLGQACRNIEQNTAYLLEKASTVDPILVQLGGGPRDLQIREIHESPIGAFLVLHWLVDVRDAMGANAVNTIMERMSPEVEKLTGGRVHLRIITNLADQRLARASCMIPS